MPQFERNVWKLGISISSLLLFLLLMVLIPAISAGAHEKSSGLAPTATVLTSPTIDVTATMNALQEDKLRQEIQQLQYQNEQIKNQNSPDFFVWLSGWFRLNAAIILSTLVVVIGALIGLFRWFGDRRDSQDKELRAQAEERFKTAIAALGDDNEATQVGGAILLRSFLNKGDKAIYGRYYTQIFDLAAAYLNTSNTSRPSEDLGEIPHSPKDSNTPMLLTPLRKALIVVFKEAFPCAWKELNHEDPQFRSQALDASGIRLDRAFLDHSNLQCIWMREASLNEVRLTEANLSGVYLRKSQLRGAFLNGADLRGADLSAADLSGAHLSRANLSDADLSDADLSGSSVERAQSLSGTKLRGVTGLTKDQLIVCKDKGAIVDETSLTSSTQSPTSPSPQPQQ